KTDLSQLFLLQIFYTLQARGLHHYYQIITVRTNHHRQRSVRNSPLGEAVGNSSLLPQFYIFFRDGLS
ncbi:hypothetical protein, partial [Microcystis aeruginosa]|uniref:hypothetical protein n=1 Tax=Microcystis aeruginosa TaxID=1126 RepID=UPI001C11350D